MTTRKTAVCYARYSSTSQRDASIADQLRVCSEWCDRHGYDLVGSYCDHAYSGRTAERPEFQRMVANAGESSIVLVYAMDRFSRDPYDAPIYKKQLRDKGVKVVSATEPMTDGPEAILLERIYEGFASMESQKISQRTLRGMEGNALKCHHNGVPVYGYRFGDDGCYVVDDGEAEVVREVFRARVDGDSLHLIAERIADKGVTTTRGNPANYGFVHTMLRNRKYMGEYRWGDVVEPGGMPAIVDRLTWEAAQDARTTKRREREEWRDYMLSGKSLCACGANLVGVSGRNRTGAKYCYYGCARNCGVKRIRADDMESMVVAALRALVASEHVNGIADVMARYNARNRESGKVSELEAAIDKARQGIDRLLDAVADGAPYATVKAKVDALQADAGKAERELEQVTAYAGFDRESFVGFLRSADGLDDAQLVDALVWRASLDREVVTVLLNYDVGGAPAWVDAPRDGSSNFEFGAGENLFNKELPPSPAETEGIPQSVWLPGRIAVLTLASGRPALLMTRAA